MDPSHSDPTKSDIKRRGQAFEHVPKSVTRVPADTSSDGAATGAAAGDNEIPEKIGRFSILRRIGVGHQAEVYVAHDDELDRLVTLKVPHLERLQSQADVDRYIAEARNTARLNHPGIVSLYDVYTGGDRLLLILEHIEGRDLAAALQAERFTPLRSAELMIAIAEAASYAHERGVIHRDLKPANILLDSDGKPRIVDFGLAVRTQGQHLLQGQIAGTPSYMSPEQARGETHRLDGRTDIWSLGVILYQLLTGQRPFSGDTTDQLFNDIEGRDVRPPRQIDRKVPRELERICLKCLSKRMTDRYASAADLATDLRLWRKHRLAKRGKTARSDPEARPASGEIEETASSMSREQPLRVVPKGLRAFDADDAEFFLRLLPGPIDRGGLPESIRFWKTRIEQTDPEETFSVGVLYGPSGCGKSSLVKAGLIPRLADHVRSIYLETTANDTPQRLARRLRTAFPQLSPDDTLVQLMISIREEAVSPATGKVVIFLDQFEQWLHAQPSSARDEMLQALRQCDGAHLQSVLLIRDDFGMSAMRFMNGLEVPVVEGQNYATVDLFDEAHAASVLGHLGRAFGRLPRDGSLSDEQQQFLREAVHGLADKGRVVCVHLILFAEMFRWRPWTRDSLRAAGGAQGIGIAFLDDTLSSGATNPRRRLHRHAARRVLQALLPPHDADMRGRALCYQELLQVSGYASRPDQFAELIEILDTELRLITPTEPPGAGLQDDGSDSGRTTYPGVRRYQLTHDFLVSPLREWLTRKQRQTRRGRAQLLLEDRASVWARRPERRHLPSPSETIRIQLLTRQSGWSPPQREMLRAAKRVHAVKILLAATLLVGVGAVGWMVKSKLEAQHVQFLVSKLMVADIGQTPEVLRQLRPYKNRWYEQVAAIAHDSKRSTPERLRAHLALVRNDPASIDFLLPQLLTASPDQLVVIRDELQPWENRIGGKLWSVLQSADGDDTARVRAACALAHFDPTDDRWQIVAEPVSRALVKENALLLAGWVGQLAPVVDLLQPSLAAIFDDHDGPGGDQIVAASVLAMLLADDTQALAQLVTRARPSQYPMLLDALAAHPDQAKKWIRKQLVTPTPAGLTLDPARLVSRRATAAISLARLHEPRELFSRLGPSPDPRLKVTLIHGLASHRVNIRQLLDDLADEPNASVRQAIVLALGEYTYSDLSLRDAQDASDQCLALLRSDPSGGVHSAAAWTLGQWERDDLVRQVVSQLQGRPATGDWYINGQGQTMLIIRPRAPVAPESPAQSTDTTPPPQTFAPFAISAHEVTIEQFQQFEDQADYAQDASPSPLCPMNKVSWYQAARYCRWLSAQEGIAEAQMVYPSIAEIKPGMRLEADRLRRTGYRLPTNAEWMAAYQAGTVTSRFFGRTDQWLDKYAWYNLTSGGHLRPVGQLKPNWFGLFDIDGNVSEWCQPVLPRTFDDRRRSETEPDQCAVRGGNYAKQAGFALFGDWPIEFPFGNQLSFVGFRIVRTVEP